MGSEDDDRRSVNIERSLGRIEGAQGSLNNRLDRIENAMGTNNTDAQESRRRLHQLLEKHGSEMGHVKERLRVVELQVEDSNNKMTMVAPMSAVSALADSHRTLHTAVEELKTAKTTVEGAAQGVRQFGRGLWAMLMAFGSFIGGAFVALVEHYMTSGSPPPGK